ncbi:hypothetical protein DUZ99_02215 [Xylanibacillus composti]|uniref:Uncharacterized protein n=1 Tax=Xylanibacillus composti TaxID=1572762 RepID=A0A8J4M1D4_9BACL|nr:hypothetical protein [Xylanibacillus composti]MDT9723810.1 hypothetical protein [Xylanibacillus composti]GIQ67416.1 hypothetical protein XYCOK13_02400 [Xylanibacillus composti]
MADLTEHSTAGEAKNFLFYHMNSTKAVDGVSEIPRSTVNSSLTKEQAWNVFFGAIMKKEDSEPIHYLALRNMIREFGSYYEDEAASCGNNHMTCIGCGLPPDQIEEYIEMAREEGTTPEQFVMSEEGTYNAFEPGRFYCTSCYVNADMPIIGEDSA